MESADIHILALGSDHLVDPPTHFVGGLVGERHGKDLVRPNHAGIDEVRRTVGDDAGFPAPGSGEDEDGAVEGLDRSTLLGIELGMKSIFEIKIHG
jgi:hypothetical protein